MATVVSPFTAAALDRALAERNAYRLTALAALDQLHDAQREIERQRRLLVDLRDELQRYTRSVVGG